MTEVLVVLKMKSRLMFHYKPNTYIYKILMHKFFKKLKVEIEMNFKLL